jgi:hypothetical protein
LKKALLGFGAVAAILLTSGAALAASTSDSAVALSFHNLPSVRVLDTRLNSTTLGEQKTLDVVIPDPPMAHRGHQPDMVDGSAAIASY